MSGSNLIQFLRRKQKNTESTTVSLSQRSGETKKKDNTSGIVR